MILKLILSLILILLALWHLSAWVQFGPPASALLILLKKLHHAFIGPVLIIYLCLLSIYSATFLYLSYLHISLDNFYVSAYFVLWFFTLLGFIYCDLIRHSIVKSSSLRPLHEKISEKVLGHGPITYTTTDLSCHSTTKLFFLYTPSSTPAKDTCIIYLSSNNQCASSTTRNRFYLKNLTLNAGYSFCVYETPFQAETDLTDIQEALSLLQTHTTCKRLILCGASTNGHLALRIAASLPAIAGVIALYPLVNPSTPNLVQDLTQPVFLIHGSYDSLAPIEMVHQLYDLMTIHNKTIDFLELPYIEHAFDTFLVNHSVVGHKVKHELNNWLYTYFK